MMLLRRYFKMSEKYCKKLSIVVKLRLYNIYYRFLPPIKVEIDSLIYPARNDIKLRIDFIHNYILKPNSNYKESSYFKFLIELKKHTYYIKDIDIDRHIKKFKDLFFSIKKNGYQPHKFGYVTIQKVNSKIKFVYPNKGEIVLGEDVKNKYILREGAHRLAVLKALNFSKVNCKIVYQTQNLSSDYSSFIKTYNNDQSHS